MKLKDTWNKIWYFLWKDDSPKGWIISILFIFVFIKFFFFPMLSLVTGTVLPLAVVESCSMYHKGDVLSSFDKWWESHDGKYDNLGITQEQFENFKMKKGFNKADVLFIVGTKPEKLEIGDIIIFNSNANIPHPVIHRIVKIKKQGDEYIFTTMGDNVVEGIQNFERAIHENQLVGKAIFKLAPFIGEIKLLGVDIWNKVVHRKGFSYFYLCNENKYVETSGPVVSLS